MKHFLLIAVLVAFASVLLADSAVELWTYSSDMIWAKKFVPLPDGGVMMAGSRIVNQGSSYVQCIFLKRIGPDGEEQMSLDYLPFDSERANCLHIFAADESSFYLVGGVSDYEGDNPFTCILKVDMNGQVIWQQSLATDGIWLDGDAALAPNGDIVIVESEQQSGTIHLARISPDGDILWQHEWTIENTSWLFMNDIAFTSDGGIVLAGGAHYTDERSVLLVDKFDASGGQIWSEVIDVNDNYYWSYPTVVVGSDDIIGVICGMGLGDWNSCLMLWAFDNEGETLWTWTPYDEGIWVSVRGALGCTQSGDFVVTGHLSTDGDTGHSFVALVDTAGAQQWKMINEIEENEYPDKIYVHPDGDVYVSSFFSCGVTNMKINSAGEYQWSFFTNILEWRNETFCNQIVAIDDPSDPSTRYVYALADDTAFGMALVCYEEEVELAVEDDLPGPNVSMTCSPNPFNPETTVSFSLETAGQTAVDVYDIRGRKVDTLLNEHLSSGEHTFVWRADGLASGVYFLRLNAPGVQTTQKALLLK